MARTGDNIYKRKDGRWEGRYIKGRKKDGKPIFGSVYAYKLKDCKIKLIEKKALYQNEAAKVKDCQQITMKKFMKQWLKTASISVKPSTISNYQNNINKWIEPFFGSMVMNQIARKDVQDFVVFLISKELSAGTIHNIYRIVNRIMKDAIRSEYLLKNPCDDIQLPENKTKKARPLANDEQKKMLKIAMGNLKYAPIILAVYTGLRIGEICALEWGDIDFKKETMHISRTMQRIQYISEDGLKKTKVITGSTKSQESDRIIPIPGFLMKFLQKLKDNSESEYVFHCLGHAMEPRTLQYRFHALLKKAGLRRMNFHSLRHTFVTRSMEIGIDTKTISELVGHASTRLTLECYSHSQIEHKRASMMEFQKFYRLSV